MGGDGGTLETVLYVKFEKVMIVALLKSIALYIV